MKKRALVDKLKAFLQFFKNSQIELRKVVWPSRQETLKTTGIVVVMVLAVAVVIWGVDSVLLWFVGALTGQRG